MAKIGVFMANGCEEIEALTVVDILRRAQIAVDMISITGEMTVTGSHGISFVCDLGVEEADFASYDGLVLPGGMPGTTNLGAHETVTAQLHNFVKAGKLVSAICAAPTVLGEQGILERKRATCYPGLEDRLIGATTVEDRVVVDKNVITSRGMGTAIPFALALVSYLLDEKTAADLQKAIVYEV